MDLVWKGLVQTEDVFKIKSSFRQMTVTDKKFVTNIFLPTFWARIYYSNSLCVHYLTNILLHNCIGELHRFLIVTLTLLCCPLQASGVARWMSRSRR